MKLRLNSINFRRGFGPNCTNTNVKITIRVPKPFFYSDDFTAKINLLTFPTIATIFQQIRYSFKLLMNSFFSNLILMILFTSNKFDVYL